MNIQIPEREYTVKFARSGGKGGQNVNKVSSKAQLRWKVNDSNVLNAEQKVMIIRELRTKINIRGELVIDSEEERDQLQNKRRAVEKLHDMVNEALIPEEERIPTKPTRSSQERRLASKVKASRQKQARRWRPEH